MRFVFWLLGIFAVAVALALLLGQRYGTVTLYWPPHRIDMSVNLALILGLALALLMHWALVSLQALFKLPETARRWREQQRKEAMVRSLVAALSQMLAGRFVRAKSAARDALALATKLDAGHDDVPLDERARRSAKGQHASVRATAAWVLAESAHALQEKTERDAAHQDAAFASAGREGASLREGLALRRARWALEDRDAHAALAALRTLAQGAQRRTLALRMQLRALRLTGDVQGALGVARLLGKHGAFSDVGAKSVRRALAAELLNSAHDLQQLQRAWQHLEPAERAMLEVVLAAVGRATAIGGGEARGWALARMDPVWPQTTQMPTPERERIALDVARLLEGHGAAIANDAAHLALLAQLEALQRQQPADAALQFLVGLACWHAQLWGKSQAMLSQAVRQLTHTELKRQCWRTLARIAQQRGDSAAHAHALQQLSQI